MEKADRWDYDQCLPYFKKAQNLELGRGSLNLDKYSFICFRVADNYFPSFSVCHCFYIKAFTW